MDETAAVVADLALNANENVPADAVFHVVNPSLYNWTNDFLPALRRAGLNFEAIPARQWIQRLKASDPDPQRNPTIKLLDFFVAKYDRDVPTTLNIFDTTQARKVSSILRKARAPDDDLIAKFLQYWNSIG